MAASDLSMADVKALEGANEGGLHLVSQPEEAGAVGAMIEGFTQRWDDGASPYMSRKTANEILDDCNDRGGQGAVHEHRQG